MTVEAGAVCHVLLLLLVDEPLVGVRLLVHHVKFHGLRIGRRSWLGLVHHEPGSRLLVLEQDVVEALGNLHDVVQVGTKRRITRKMFLELGFETIEK